MEAIDVVVIGAGQAGLATSYCLTQQGLAHVVFEENRVAESWRSRRWESFCLVTPNWTVQLPGFPYQGPDPDGFMSRDEIVTHLDAYAASCRAPVRTGTRVSSLDRAPDGDRLRVKAGETTVETTAVVVATGAYQRPRLPAAAGNLAAELFQIHSSEYSNPRQLPAGAVLVVGTGQSGAQIAEELHESGREVFLSVSSCGRVPRRYRGKDMLQWAVQLGLMDRTVDMLKSPAEKFVCHPHTSGRAGGHDIYLRNLGREGVILLGRVQSTRDGKVILAADLNENLAKADEFAENVLQQLDAAVEKLGMALPDDLNPRGIGGDVPYESRPILELDLRASGITSVVWATGYQLDFTWIRLPVLDQLGYPIQQRGVSPVAGLYFVGLEWLYKPKSGLLLGVGEDAAHVSSMIATRAQT
jgi:putative flavoprotein involved in K+ transport